MKHNGIILIIDGTSTFHNSIADAIDVSHSSKYDDAKIANIYVFLKTARKSGFRWGEKIPEHPPLKRETNIKKRHRQRWSDTEQKLLVQAVKDKKTVKEIAISLHRTEKAIILRIYKTITQVDLNARK